MSFSVVSATDLNNTESSDILNQNSDDSFEVNELSSESDADYSNEIISEDYQNDYLNSNTSYIFYVGQNTTDDGGNGSKENPFASLQLACDNVNEGDNVTINLLNGTHYVSSLVTFKSSNLIINGIGDAIITNGFNGKGKVYQALSLSYNLANITFNNVIFDQSGVQIVISRYFYPFYIDVNNNMNLAIFNNCTFIGSSHAALIGASEFNFRFIKCIFKDYGRGSSSYLFKNFLNGKYPGSTDYRYSYFEDCIFLNTLLTRIAQQMVTNKNITVNGVWFGENDIPDYMKGLTAVTPQNTYNGTIDIPISKYAIFSVSENYLGNNQYEIIGKLCWNGTNDSVGDAFAPMTVTLTSSTGDIISNATLENGTFKTVYTSNSTDNKLTATLDYETIELNFTNVDIQLDAPSIYYGDNQNVTLTLPQAVNTTITVTVNNKTYEVIFNDTDSVTYTIEDILTEGNYTVDVLLNDEENQLYGSNSTVLGVSKVSDYTFDVVIPTEVTVGENATISIILPEDVTGSVNITFGDIIKVLDANQTITVNFSNLNATDYNVNVTYCGSDKYTSKSKQDSVSVDPAQSSISIDDAVFTYGETIAVPFSAENATCVKVNVLQDGVIIANYTSVSDNITIDALDAGNYTLKVTTNVTSNYEEATATVNLTIEKASSSISVSDSEFTYATEMLITAESVNSTGDIIASLVDENNDTIAVSVSGDNITLTDLSAGVYTLTVTTNVDDNHINATGQATVTVVKATPTVEFAIPENIKEGNNDYITIILPSDATGYVLIDVSDKKYYAELSKGIAILNTKDILAGNYTITAKYLGDTNYNENQTQDSLEIISKSDANIKIEVPSEIKVGDTIVINITSDSDAVLEVLINQETQTLVNGTVTYTVTSANRYAVIVKANESDDYQEDLEIETFEAVKNDATVTITLPEKITVGEEISIAVESDSDAAITVLFDGENQEIVNGTVSVVVSEGDHNIVAYVNETETYNAFNAFESFYVTKKDSSVNVTASDVFVGQKSTVNVTIPSDATGFVIITVDDETRYVVELLQENTAVVDVLFDTAGNHTVSATYLGDNTYDVSNSEDITVAVSEKESVEANITVSDLTPGEDANVTVDIPGATGNVSVIIDGVETNVALDENGTAVVPIENLTAGEHSIVVIYSGDETHAPFHNATIVYSEDYSTRFDNLTVSGDLVIAGVLVNALGDAIPNATITYSVGNVSGNLTTGDDGSFTIAGENNVEVSIEYAGSNIYLGTTVVLSLEGIAQVRSGTLFNVTDGFVLTAYAVDYSAGERGAYFDVLLTDTDGNPLVNQSVVFGINGWVHNKTTDENGVAHLQINLAEANKYTVAPCYLGNTTYNATFASAMVKVVKKPITISASAKSYKASVKTKKYTVTLKTIKGSSADGKTYLKSGKKVTLKVNGKTYTAKINAKGKATFKITKLSKKATYKAVVKFAGDKTYEVASKTVKITVK